MLLGILECDHVNERFRHIAGDYSDMFARLFKEFAPQIDLRFFDVCRGDWPALLDACDGYLATGSKFSVYDDLDWIRTLKGFVRELNAAGKPYVGICFGHQMLAEALGGRVAKAETGWGAGVHEICGVGTEAWMDPRQPICKLHFMHQDQILRMPESGVLLGRSDHCPISMFRAGRRMLGIQAHPEFPAEYIEALLHDRIELIGRSQVDEALRRLAEKTDEGIIVKWITQFLEANVMTGRASL